MINIVIASNKLPFSCSSYLAEVKYGEYVYEMKTEDGANFWRYRSYDGTRTDWELYFHGDNFLRYKIWNFITEDELPINFVKDKS